METRMISSDASIQRRHELDWIRVLAFSLLILFHTGMMFNTWAWHVKNNQTIGWLEPIMGFLHQWRIPLLFFVSGSATWYMLGKYSVGRFVVERTKRLLLPLLFGMFVVVPPQVYFERLFQGQTYSFAAFYSTIFQWVPYPDGNLSWHHLWYLPYIFMFSLMALPLLVFFKRGRGRRWLGTFQDFVSKGNRVYLLFLPVAVSEIALRPFWPHDANNLLGDWAQFAGMLIIFVLGFGLVESPSLWEALAGKRWRSLALACTGFAFVLFSWELDVKDPPVWLMSVYFFFRSLNMWLWIVAGLGLARQYLMFSNKTLEWAKDAVYPFYILHQTITVSVGFYLAPLDMAVGLKFLLLALATFGGCWLLYEGLIKRINLLRVCFGLKWRTVSTGRMFV